MTDLSEHTLVDVNVKRVCVYLIYHLIIKMSHLLCSFSHVDTWSRGVSSFGNGVIHTYSSTINF